MPTVTAVVVGAGHCGLAMSRHLSAPTVLNVNDRPLQRILPFLLLRDSQPLTRTFELATIFPRATRPKKLPRFRTFARPAPSESWR